MERFLLLYKRLGLLALTALLTIYHGQAQLTNKQLLQSHQPNVYSFSTADKKVAKAKLPTTLQNAVEVVEKRTATSRFFTDKDTASKFYSIQSLGAINYYKNGAWQIIDTRLKPNSNGTFTAPNQEEPVGFDTKKQASFISVKNQPVYFNQWILYGEKNGVETMLAKADWRQFTAGDEGLHITQIFPGIDAEMIVRKGAIKTNFIVSKNQYPQYEKLVFKDRLNNAVGNGSFLKKAPSLQTQATEFVAGTARLTIAPAYMYAQGNAKASYLPIVTTSNNNEFSLSVDANYLRRYLPSGPVIIDPLVSATSTLAQASITGSKNCGSETLTCDYSLTVAAPAKATFTDVSWQFGFEAIEDMTEGYFSFETGTCNTGFYSVLDPQNNKKPGTVSSQGDWVSVAADILPCLPAPSCAAQNVTFKLKFVNVNCSGGTACSDAFVKASEPWQMLIEGRTLEMTSTTASATTICAGAPTTLTTKGNFGVPPYTYSWNDGAGGTSTSNPGTASPTTTTTYTATITDQCGTTATGSAKITVNPVPIITSATSNSPVCEGSTLQINTTAIAGATLAWTGPNGFTSANANNSIPNATAAATGTYTVIATQGNCPSLPVSVDASVGPPVTPAVSITASATTVCAGTSITFTATATNAGTSPAFQWKINGVNAGTNSNTFSSTTLDSADAITCVVTTSATCTTSPTANSNSITILVNKVVTPAVSISASAANICAGTSVTFTATPVNGGASPTYQWKLNGSNTGTNSNQYTSTGLANNDVVICEITTNADCSTTPTATSNSIKITVNPLIAPSISIVATDSSVCTNTNVIFTATIANGGNQPIYQWKLNGNNVGTNSATYSSNTLANNDQITCELTSNIGCPTSPTVLSGIITMEVSAPVTPTITINVADTSICQGANATFTATITNGGATPTYQWKLNGTNTGTNSPSYASATLKNGDKITCTVTSNAACVTNATAISNTITIKVNTIITAAVSITASATEVCAGTPIIFTSTTTNTGSTAPTYLWKINGLATTGNSQIFTTNNIPDGALVTVEITPQNVGCLASPTSVSNTIEITVNATPIVSAGNDTTIFRGSSFLLRGQATGSIATYQWTPPTYLNNTAIRNPLAFPQETITYTLTATSPADCSAFDTVRIKVLTRIEVPNAFSPNGDGINDTWNIVGLTDYEGATLEIFDRYGQAILKSTGYNKPWDGTRNGKPLPVATYYYIIQPQNGLLPITGSVTLLR